MIKRAHNKRVGGWVAQQTHHHVLWCGCLLSLPLSVIRSLRQRRSNIIEWWSYVHDNYYYRSSMAHLKSFISIGNWFLLMKSNDCLLLLHSNISNAFRLGRIQITQRGACFSDFMPLIWYGSLWFACGGWKRWEDSVMDRIRKQTIYPKGPKLLF